MYDKAFREFDGNNYAQALKDLDAIDARQPDLAESQNLRGVILMRQKDYPNAEKALEKALAADPKFWNARFNLAEIPFLEKKWPEARKRFQSLLDGNAAELQGEATQLIQYKILITYLMEGKEDMVRAMVAKFELSPDTPALHYANAAIALNGKKEKEAKDALAAAEKDFSPQLNKLFAESLYEVGWMEKPAGQARAALELNSVAEKAAQAKAFAKAKFDQAEQALQQRDFTAARKLIDEVEAADPNQAAVANLRGEIALEQKDFAGAEAEFRKAQQLDPNYRDAQYNLAQVPFKKGEYEKARDRFEALFSTTSGTDKDRAAQLIKFKIYLTLLLEGKDSRAQKMMEQFQFTGDTPALYYAQAAWEFKHDNAAKANDWVTSARKIYPLALNGVFADSFFDLGWLQAPSMAEANATVAEGGQTEAAPSIEPTPLPAVTLAQNAPNKPSDPLSMAAQTQPAIPGMEATLSQNEGAPAASSVLAAASSPSVETPVASTASPAASAPVVAQASGSETSAVVASPSPATILAPAKVREWSEPTFGERLERFGIRNVAIVGPLLLISLLILGWVAIPMLRRRSTDSLSDDRAPNLSGRDDSPGYEVAAAMGGVEELIAPGRLAGGPPQVSLQLRASEPALRRGTAPLAKTGVAGAAGAESIRAVVLSLRLHRRSFRSGPSPKSRLRANPPRRHLHIGVAEPASSFSEGLVEQENSLDKSAPAVTGTSDFTAPEGEFVHAFESTTPIVDEDLATEVEDEFATFTQESPVAAEDDVFSATEDAAVEDTFVPNDEIVEETVAAVEPIEEETFEVPETIEFASVVADEILPEAAIEEPTLEVSTPKEEASEPSLLPEVVAVSEAEMPAVSERETLEPVGQGSPIPYLTPAPAEEPTHSQAEKSDATPMPIAAIGAGLAGIGALRHSVAPSPSVEAVSNEPAIPQSTTPVTMPQPTQPTPAPVLRTPTGAAPQPSGAGQAPSQPMPGGMHTAVQLTFSFEIASLQLTSSFKMGALQLKPTSKIVTMRLAPSQQPQPAMNLQVTFEVASVQLAGNSIGVIRLTPSQQQRPGINSSPSFNVAGFQLVQGADAAPVQITPSQQGQASVHVTAGFQIATVEFSPSFEIASIILNSTSRNVSVQLPGAGPSAIEGAPVFEIGSVQVGNNGELGMMQLNPQGSAKRAPGAQ